MRVLSNVEQSHVPAGLAPLVIGAAKCVVGADAGIVGYGAAAQVSGGSTSGCGAVVAGLTGCVAAVVNPFAGAAVGLAGQVAAAVCDRPRDRDYARLVDRYEGSSRDPRDANYENEMDRSGR